MTARTQVAQRNRRFLLCSSRSSWWRGSERPSTDSRSWSGQASGGPKRSCPEARAGRSSPSGCHGRFLRGVRDGPPTGAARLEVAQLRDVEPARFRLRGGLAGHPGEGSRRPGPGAPVPDTEAIGEIVQSRGTRTGGCPRSERVRTPQRAGGGWHDPRTGESLASSSCRPAGPLNRPSGRIVGRMSTCAGAGL